MGLIIHCVQTKEIITLTEVLLFSKNVSRVYLITVGIKAMKLLIIN